MSGTLDFESYRKCIHSRAREGLRLAGTGRDVAEVVGSVAAMAEATLVALQDPEERRYIACRPGCGTCCVVNVTVLLPEAMAITDYLDHFFDPASHESLHRGITELQSAIRWLDDEERLFLRRPCAFLDTGGNCSIYPVRPLLCRSVTSTDAEACRRAIALPALGEASSVLMNQFQKTLMDVTYRGLAGALEDLGFDARGKRLTEAVKDLLDNPALASLGGIPPAQRH